MFEGQAAAHVWLLRTFGKFLEHWKQKGPFAERLWLGGRLRSGLRYCTVKAVVMGKPLLVVMIIFFHNIVYLGLPMPAGLLY